MTPAQRKALEELDKDAHLSARDLVEAAQPEDHILHDLFIWDNEMAGDNYRLDQARGYIRTIRVQYVRTVTEVRCPVYVRDPELPKRQQGYVRVSLLRTRHEQALSALQNEIDAVAGRIERARVIARELDLAPECEAMLMKLVCPPEEEPVEDAAASSASF